MLARRRPFRPFISPSLLFPHHLFSSIPTSRPSISKTSELLPARSLPFIDAHHSPPANIACNINQSCHPIPPALSPEARPIFSLLCNASASPSRYLDNLLKDYKDKLTSELVLEILSNYRHLGRANTLEFFSWAGFQLGFMFNDAVVEYMADFLGRRKLFDDLKCLLKTVSSQGGRISCRAISICIRFLGRQGRIGEALCLFEEMEAELSCVPDNLVYNNMLYVLCKKVISCESIDIAVTIFRRIESPDVYSYSNMIVGLCKFGSLEKALQLFDEMTRAGLVPTRTAVNMLIREFCELSKKQGLVDKVRVRNIRRPFDILVPSIRAPCGILNANAIFWVVFPLGLLPSASVISYLVAELCRSRNIGEAVEILEIVVNRKLCCMEDCFTIVIQALCEVQRLEEACAFFNEMIHLEQSPKLAVYNSIICAFCKLGEVGEAEKYFSIMNKKRRSPNTVTYTALIHAYCEAQNIEAAYEMLMEMLGLGFLPYFRTYEGVDRLLKEQRQHDLLVKLEVKMETTLLLKYCKTGQLEGAYDKLKTMLARGYSPPLYIRQVFECTFQKFGKWNLARDLLDKIDQKVN